jgi:hypothetical protein
MAFKFLIFLNGFPIFLNCFPLSKKSGKNLSTAAKLRKIAIRASYFPLEIAIFRDKIIGGWNTNNRRLEYERSLFELRIFASELRNSC